MVVLHLVRGYENKLLIPIQIHRIPEFYILTPGVKNPALAY